MQETEKKIHEKKQAITIALILPRAGIYRFGTGAFSRFIRYSPMTLPTLAALVPAALQATVELYDEGVEKIDPEKINADIVGITGITGASKRMYAYADYFRGRGIYVVLGGVHATLLPQEALQHADTVITGHAYETWPRFLQDFAAAVPQRLYTPPEGKTDFAKFKTPLRRHLKYRKFITLNSVQAVFGCPNSCDFCVTPVVCRRYEARPVEQVIDDIRSMQGRYMTFVDPSPIENVDYALELYRAMVPLKKTWTGLATTRLLGHPELMDVMARSGCRGLLIGFESLSQQTNNGIHKAFNSVANYYDLVRELHRRGIAIMGCFVHGLDGDDPDCFDQTLEFVVRAHIDLPRFTVCTPFPGTPFFNRLKQEGRILTENWALYDAQHVVFRPRGMTPGQLAEGHHRVWRQAYGRRAIAGRLLGSRCFLRYSILANIAYRLYGMSLPHYSDDRMERDHLLSCPAHPLPGQVSLTGLSSPG
jgi:radical SAM superfamily enzyme YgiQ (UPF0313 family)